MSEGTIKIPTAFGPVSEMARKQAAENIKEDANLRAKVMEIILREVSKPRLTEEENKVLAEAEFARRYPEVFETSSGLQP